MFCAFKCAYTFWFCVAFGFVGNYREDVACFAYQWCAFSVYKPDGMIDIISRFIFWFALGAFVCVCSVFHLEWQSAAENGRKINKEVSHNRENKSRKQNKEKKKYEKSKTSLIVVVVNVTFWHRSDATADKYEWNRSRDFRIKRNLNFRIWYVAWKCDSIWAMTDSMKLTTTQSTAWRSFGFWCFRSETKDFYQRCNYTNGKFQMSI